MVLSSTARPDIDAYVRSYTLFEITSDCMPANYAHFSTFCGSPEHTNNNLGLTYHAAHGRLEGTALHYSLYIQFHLCLWLRSEVQPLVWLHWTRNELPCAHVLHHLRQRDLFFGGFCNWRHPSTSPRHRHRPSPSQ